MLSGRLVRTICWCLRRFVLVYVHCKAATSSSGFLDYFNCFLYVLSFLCSFSSSLKQVFVSSFLFLLVGCVLYVPVVFYFSRDSHVSHISDSWTSISFLWQVCPDFFSFLLLLQSQGASVQVVKCLV